MILSYKHKYAAAAAALLHAVLPVNSLKQVGRRGICNSLEHRFGLVFFLFFLWVILFISTLLSSLLFLFYRISYLSTTKEVSEENLTELSPST